jgi:SAM-dependent methyltransferase
MIQYITSILNSNNSNQATYKWLLTIAIVYAGVKLVNTSKTPFTIAEGFNQNKPYVYKKDEDIYDEFYSEVYDMLNNTIERSDNELAHMIRLTSPDVNNSVFLDVGSGTGYTVDLLRKNGYKAYGVDKSKSMIEYAENLYPKSDFINNNVMDSMLFEQASFTHILCTKMTLYQIQDKLKFLNNCYKWMIPNGYLILHLVDRKRFNIIKPRDDNEIKWQPFIEPKKKRIKKIISEYEDFKYKAAYNFPVNLEESPISSYTETFTDKVTNNIRHQEMVLYMEDIREILNIAKKAGFIFHAKVDMGNDIGDDNQYLYILERPH